MAHESLNAFARDALAVTDDQLGVDARGAVDAPVGLVDRADALEQPRVLELAGGERPLLPTPETRSG